MLLGRSLGLSPDLLASIINTSVSSTLLFAYILRGTTDSYTRAFRIDRALLVERDQQSGAKGDADRSDTSRPRLHGRVP